MSEIVSCIGFCCSVVASSSSVAKDGLHTKNTLPVVNSVVVTNPAAAAAAAAASRGSVCRYSRRLVVVVVVVVVRVVRVLLFSR